MTNQKKEIVLYTGGRCPLCDDARTALEMVAERHALHYIERDIYKKEEWLENYQMMIPVLTVDEEVALYGNIRIFELEALLRDF